MEKVAALVASATELYAEADALDATAQKAAKEAAAVRKRAKATMTKAAEGLAAMQATGEREPKAARRSSMASGGGGGGDGGDVGDKGAQRRPAWPPPVKTVKQRVDNYPVLLDHLPDLEQYYFFPQADGEVPSHFDDKIHAVPRVSGAGGVNGVGIVHCALAECRTADSNPILCLADLTTPTRTVSRGRHAQCCDGVPSSGWRAS